MKLNFSLRTLLFSAGCAALFSTGLVRAEGLQSGDFVMMCGDSVTAQRLYPSYLEEYFLACQPAPKLEAMQAGWAGEMLPQFVERMKNDLLVFKPTVTTITYGTFDGRFNAAPMEMGDYRKALEAMVKTFQDNGVRLVAIGGPGAVDPDLFKKDPTAYNKAMADLGAMAKEVAEKNGQPYVDVQGAMLDAMAKAKAKYGNTASVTGPDGIQPTANGSLVIAYAFLKALGCKGEVGTITLDFASGKAETTAGHKVLSSKAGTAEIESTRYPFCFTGTGGADPNSTLGATELVPFNQDLNRFLLVVKNAPAGQVKVTWGDQTKEFASADLAKGINLAAEFPVNPFSKPFADVVKAVNEQQIFESTAIKYMLHLVPNWRAAVPESEETYQHLVGQIMKKAEGFREASAKAVAPVKYTITVATP